MVFGGANPAPMPGDANRDGVVDDVDASILGANWLVPSGATWADGDFNSDGKVDDRDAAILAAHWTGGGEGRRVGARALHAHAAGGSGCSARGSSAGGRLAEDGPRRAGSQCWPSEVIMPPVIGTRTWG